MRRPHDVFDDLIEPGGSEIVLGRRPEAAALVVV